MNAMDFDDLLVRTVNVLELFPEVRARYGAAFRHVLVDEYQDTNHVQYRLLQLLAGGERPPQPHGRRRRRAVDLRLPRRRHPQHPRLPGRLPGRRRSSRLEQNYRSTQTILSAANAVIAHNRGQMAKHLWTDLGEGDLVKVRELDDEHAEARYVVGEVERLVDEGVSRAEIAIFYRMNSQSRVLEDTLVRREIGYQVIGGTKFYERAEIKDAMAYLTVLANPQDAVSFTRVANSPKRGIGQTSLSRVLAHAEHDGRHGLGRGGRPGVGARARARRRCGRSSASWRRWRGCASASSSGVPVGDLLEAVLARVRLPRLRWRPSARSRPRGAWRTSRSSSRSRASSTPRPRPDGDTPRRLPAAGRARRRQPTRAATTRAS